MISVEILFDVFAFILGAAIGSFLNVAIYRLPRDLSVNEPRRSFCPSCKYQIPWYQNLPLISWLTLCGRCANCGAKIAFRYFAVELLTALVFLMIWRSFEPQVAIAYWVFAALAIAATFIDFEHFIIPDEISIGGAVVGIVASFLVPTLMGYEQRFHGLIASIASAALGYALLWVVLELGKLAFGKKRIRLDAPTPFTWTRNGDDAEFVVGDEKTLWSDFFARENDRLVLRCEKVTIDEGARSITKLEFHYNRVAVGDESIELDQISRITGVATELQIPREAMGRGDLKFLAAIGAFLGWRGVLFSVFGGSLIGSIVGIGTLIIGRRAWSAKLPFGPYLALGAFAWMFFGPALLAWYQAFLRP